MAPKFVHFRTSDGRVFKKPIPLQVQREMDVCQAMDALEAAMATARADVSACTAGTGAERAEAADPSAQGVARLAAAIGRVDTAGNDLVAKLKVLFAL